MSQSAGQIAPQGPTGLEGFTLTRRTPDLRADNACRTVKLSTTVVTIDRVVDGVRMRVGVPVAAYCDLAITVRAPSGRASLTLRHTDSDLDVIIGTGEAVDVARAARAWSIALGKPVAIEAACVSMDAAQPRRRRGRAATPRRSRFLQRRTPGLTSRMGTSFAAEREIIART